LTAKLEKIHPEGQKRPWDRTSSYRIGAMRMGRPDLPHVEAEIEGLVRAINTLPQTIPWWPGEQLVSEVADEVHALLWPRIITVTLGNVDEWTRWYLAGPGDSELRCAFLCVKHPTEDLVGDLAPVNPGGKLLSDWRVFQLVKAGHERRKNLRMCILRSAQAALQEMNRHWIHDPSLSKA
jgi:hypothetical protein